MQPDAAPAAAPAAMRDAEAGPAYVVTSAGLFRIDGTAPAAVLDRGRGRYPGAVLDRDGHLWHDDGHGRITRHAARRTTVRLPRGAWVATMAAAADGGVWVTATEDGERLKLYRIDASAKVTGVRLKGPGGAVLAEAPDGWILDDGDHVWIAGTHGLGRFSAPAATWEVVREGHVHELARDRSGVLWTVDRAIKRVLGLDGDRWIELPFPPDVWAVLPLTAAPDGRMVAGLVDERQQRWVARFARQGAAAAWVHAPAVVREPDGAITVDGRGRTWVARRGGLVVVDPDGRLLAEYPNATLPGVAGSEVLDLAIVRGGPDELPAPVPATTGSLRGRLVDLTGRPLHGAFELCVLECDGRTPAVAIDTGDDGRFAVDGVTITDYSVVRRRGDDDYSPESMWRLRPRGIRGDFTCCLQLRPGATLDLGTLAVDLTP